MANVDYGYKCKRKDIEYTSRLYEEQEIKKYPYSIDILTAKIKKCNILIKNYMISIE